MPYIITNTYVAVLLQLCHIYRDSSLTLIRSYMVIHMWLLTALIQRFKNIRYAYFEYFLLYIFPILGIITMKHDFLKSRLRLRDTTLAILRQAELNGYRPTVLFLSHIVSDNLS